jgi:hypothetical protein
MATAGNDSKFIDAACLTHSVKQIIKMQFIASTETIVIEEADRS